MRIDLPVRSLAVAFVLLMGCDRGEQTSSRSEGAEVPPPPALEAPPPRKEKPPSPPPSQGSAALVLTGAINKELKGPIVTCGHTYLDGRDQGGTWAIRSDELDLQIMATSDAEFDNPSVILNVKQPARVSYVFKKKAGTVTAHRARTLATIDADLHNVVGKETVHVKGIMTCPAR